MKLSKNVICFQKGFIQFNDAGVDNRSVAMTVQAELMHFGYMLDDDAFVMLGKADKADIVDFHNQIIDYLNDMTGGGKTYRSFYPGFPAQVMDMNATQMWWDQIHNYHTYGKWTPSDWTKEFPTAFETVKYKEITPGTPEKFLGIFTDLCSVSQSLTPTDLATIKWFVSTDQKLVFPSSIPFKENLCTLAGMGLDVPVKTTTDVLRIAVFMSGGDISLPAVPKAMKKQRTTVRYRRTIETVKNPEREAFMFKKFKRSERKHILGLLEKTNCDVRDMKLKVQRWLRLGEIIHPGEYKSEFPRAYAAFERIRNHKVTSWYGQVEEAFKIGFGEGLRKTAERPGEFLRRLDWWVRTGGKANLPLILASLFDIAVKASNKVIFEVFTHFEGRNVPLVNRTIFIKGARKKTPLPNLSALPADVIAAIQDTMFLALKEKIKQLEPIGDCWVDPDLKRIPLPTNMRSMSEAIVPVIRGQRVPIGDVTKTLRAFVHIPNKSRSEMTIDLSTIVVGNGKTVTVDWHNLRERTGMILHSGDSYGRVGNVSEYIDFDLVKLRETGFKWALIQVNNYSSSPELVTGTIFGFCEVEFPNANAKWQPETIILSMKPKIPHKVNLLLIDLVNLDYILLDEDGEGNGSKLNNISSQDIEKVIAQYSEFPKLSVYDLLQWHCEARGRLVSKETANKHFLYEDFSTSYIETLKYMGI